MFGVLLLAAVLSNPASAVVCPSSAETVEPACVFKDHAVLQRSAATPVFGFAAAGTTVTVELGGVRQTVKTGADGRWLARLDLTGLGNGPYELRMNGCTVRDVLVGEVWLCSGQSNMSFSMGEADDYAVEKALTNDWLRCLVVGGAPATAPQTRSPAWWLRAQPSETHAMTAVGYEFAKRLQAVLKCPVGFVEAAVGASALETWCDPAYFAPGSAAAAAYEKQKRDADRYRDYERDCETARRAWEKTCGRADRPEKGIPEGPWRTLDSQAADAFQQDAGAVWLRRTVKGIAPDVAHEIVRRRFVERIWHFDLSTFEIYWNGRRLARHFAASPLDKHTERFTIPAEDVRAENTLIVRAFNAETMYHLPFTLSLDDKRLPFADWEIHESFKLPPMTAAARQTCPPRQRHFLVMHYPSAYHNGKIAPIAPMGLAGVIWYQGESNASTPARARAYADLFPAFINSWRTLFRKPDLPFAWCQLAAWQTKATDPNAKNVEWPLLRDSQDATLALPHTGQAVLIDAGEERDIHPRDKRTPGARLAAWALNTVYGRSEIPYKGPRVKHACADGSRVVVTFADCAGGLVVRDLGAQYIVRSKTNTLGPVKRNSPAAQVEGFAVAGSDGVWRWADEATIAGDTVVVSSRAVPQPVAVRYAWAQNPWVNLYNADGFPAVPFSCDAVKTACAAQPLIDFATRPGWRVDFGKFTDAAEARGQYRQDAAGAHVLIDRARDDGNSYGALCGYGAGRLLFTATNRLVRLTVKAARPSPIGRRVKLRMTDGEGEVMQWNPVAVKCVGDRWFYDYRILEHRQDGAPGGTWGGKRRNGGTWDGPLTLWEINWDWGPAASGEVVFERLEEVEETVIARDVRTRHPVMPLVTDKDVYRIHNATLLPTNDTLVVSLDGPSCWLAHSGLLPGPRRWAGAEEMVLHLSEAVPGGAVTLELRDEKTRKTRKWTQPWTKEVRFPTKLSCSDAFYLAALAFGRPAKSSPVTFTILGMDAEELRTAAEALELDVETGSPLHLINRPEHRPVACLRNLSLETRRWTGRLCVADYFGTQTEIPFDRTIASGDVARIPLAVPEKNGHYRLTCTVKGADGSETEREVAFAKLTPRTVTPAWAKGVFRFGVNYHIARYSKKDRALTQDAMVAMGCKLSRSDLLSMSQICPREGVWNWAWNDELLGELEARGIALNAIIYTCPAWARAERLNVPEAKTYRRLYCSPMRPGIYRAFCEKLASRYGTRVAYYEIGNEWDLTDPRVLTVEEAMAMQREAYAGLHAGCAEAVCIPNGWACPLTSRHPAMRDDFQRRFMTEARDAYDVYAIHLHGAYESYARTMRNILAFRAQEGLVQPWYSNETALTSVNGAEDAVAVTVWQKILFAWTHGSTDYIWYNLRGTGFDPADGEQGYGLVSGDFYPRPGMASFSGLVETLGQLRMAGLVADTDQRLVGRFEGVRGGVAVTAFAGWDRAAGEEVPLRVRTDASRAWAVDLMGNRTPAKVVAGTLVWPLSNVPRALLLEGGTRSEIDADDVARPVTPRARAVKVGADFPSAPQFTLDSFTQMVELYQADPAHAHRTWKGKADLSARVFLAGDAQRLRVRAEVLDDVAAVGDALVVCVKSPEGPLTKVSLTPSARQGSLSVYGAELVRAQFGLAGFAQAGVGVVVREDDGEGCDGWLESAENLGDLATMPHLPRLQFVK